MDITCSTTHATNRLWLCFVTQQVTQTLTHNDEKIPCDKWVPATTEWCVFWLQMEVWPPIWGVAVNILNKQSRTVDKGWSSSLGVGRGANASPWKRMLRNTHKARYFNWRQNYLEANYSPTQFSGGRGVFLEEVSRSRQRKRDFFLGKWNVRSWIRIGTGGEHLWVG
jgi:hypothetical protein